jgi:cytochrome c-type biogenesis protein CcmH
MADTKPEKSRISPATIALAGAGLVSLVAVVVASTRGGGETQTNNMAAAAPAAPDIGETIAKMRQGLATDPDNHEGWFMLGLALKGEGQFAEAQAAFRRAMQLKPDEPKYLAGLAEMLLVNGSGASDREAEELLRKAHEADRTLPAPRYYLAILKDQNDQHREALDDLIALLKDVPAEGAPWEQPVRTAIDRIARANDIDVAGRVPAARSGAAAPSPASAAIPGPTSEQMEAARGIPPSQQEEMVKGMVDRLAARLRQNPRDERGWMMLMRSRVVQGEQQAAAEALRSALAAFADDAAAQQRLRTAAAELGLPQG